MVKKGAAMTEQLKYFAFLTMIIDHVSMLYFPDFYYGRFIGRLAAPLFFYCLVIGFRRTSNLRSYLARLLSWAVVSQFVIWGFVGFEPYLNILFTLTFSLIFLHYFNSNISYVGKFFLIILFSVLAELFKFEYGFYAILFVTLFYYYQFSVLWLMVWAIFVFCLFYFNTSYFFILPLPTLILLFEKSRFEFPRLNFYFLYPLQWVVVSLPLFVQRLGF